MNRKQVQLALKELVKNIDEITDKRAVAIIKALLNLVEVLAEENERLRSEIQDLKNEINRLKGEQGKPRFGSKLSRDLSSEKERKSVMSPVPRKKKKMKNGRIKIDRQEICEVNQSQLPSDAQFKGYVKTVIQDIKITSNNVEFKREKFYSPSQKKAFVAELPAGYYGEFGPALRSLIISLYNSSGMTEPSIERFVSCFDMQISRATISRIITDNHEAFHQEKEDIVDAGLRSTSYQHIDDTGAKVMGKKHNVQILCNKFYTAYFTTTNKERLTIIDILSHGKTKYTLNNTTYEMLEGYNIRKAHLKRLKQAGMQENLTKNEIDEILDMIFTDSNRQTRSRRFVLEASSIVYYRTLDYAAKHLVCDEAYQFNKITEYKAICWVHAGRHFKRLNPIIASNKVKLEEFIKKYWNLYRQLYDYTIKPAEKFAQMITDFFDKLFSVKTGYEALDKLIEQTSRKKEWMLTVLEFPYLPLHNNAAELGARVQARKRDISLQTRNEKGTKAKDTFATIVQTARKLQVNIYDYIYDRISGRFQMPSLASLIALKSQKNPTC